MSDRPDLINSELGGMSISGTDQCFKPIYLKRMFDSSGIVEMNFGQDFFVSVDPMAGGEKSDFAVVSFIIKQGIYEVCVSLLMKSVVSCKKNESFYFFMYTLNRVCFFIIAHKERLICKSSKNGYCTMWL